MELIESYHDAKIIILEDHPYEKCPHCGEYQFTRLERRRWVTPDSLFSFLRVNGEYETEDEWYECHNCHYEE
jgi:YgiT-type zinc finger domain-containing protein